jgi:hypothetical protein
MKDFKVVVTNKDNGEKAIIEDMYLWFLLYEQMKVYDQDTKAYDITFVNGTKDGL